MGGWRSRPRGRGGDQQIKAGVVRLGVWLKPEARRVYGHEGCRNWVDHRFTDQSPERDAERVEARGSLAVGLGQIVGGGKDALTLTHLNEYSQAEAAELLDWSVTR